MFRRKDVLAVVALASVLSGLVVAGPAQAAATGEWVGTLRVTQTKAESGPHYAGSGPNLDLQVSGSQANPTVDSFAYDGNTEFDYGVFNTCHEHTDRQLVSYVSGGGQFIAGLADPTSLRVQAGISGWTYDLTQTYTGSSADGCGQSSSTGRIEAGAFASSTLVTLIDPDQEAVRGTIVTLDLVGNDPGGVVITSSHIHEEIFYEVHRNCTGFDADGGGVSDCDELDDGTDPSLGTDDLGGPVDDCEGPITKDDVIGPDPLLAATRQLDRFTNDDAICDAWWVPTLDSGFTPQGLALVGDGTVLVSGYMKDAKSTLRIVHFSLDDGSLIDSQDFPGGGHGGGIAIDTEDRVWVASTNKLYMWENVAAVFFPTAAKFAVRSGSYDMSYIAQPTGSSLYIGSFASNELLQFPVSTVLTKVNATKPKLKKLTEADATSIVLTGTMTQGAAFNGSDPWTAASVTATKKISPSTCGTLSLQVLASRTRYGFAPGIEEIEFDASGLMFMVSEAGAAKYPLQFFPVVASVDLSRVDDVPPTGCQAGI